MKLRFKIDPSSIVLNTQDNKPLFSSEESHKIGENQVRELKQECPVTNINFSLGGGEIEMEISMEESIQNIKNIKGTYDAIKECIIDAFYTFGEIKATIEEASSQVATEETKVEETVDIESRMNNIKETIRNLIKKR